MKYKKVNNLAFEFLEKWALSFSALALLAIWAFLEPSIWFIVPDFLLFILAILQPKKFHKFLLVSIIFSLIGISAYFAFVYNYHDLASSILDKTPLVKEGIMEEVSSIYQEKGIIGSLWQATTIIPSKVWTFQAVQHNFNFIIYLLLLVPSRFIRMFFAGIFGALAGIYLRKIMKNHILIILLFYTVIFLSLLFYLES